MSGIGSAVAAVAVGAYSAHKSAQAQKKAAAKAAGASERASEAGIAEERRQFDAIQKLFAPYVTGGRQAFTEAGRLAGLRGDEIQQQEIAQIAAGPEMQALTQQGENAILQNASATGGLRGGNTQAALAQFRPAALSSLIEQRLNRLMGISQFGQSSAAGQAAAGQQSSANVTNLLGQIGSAQSGAALARGQATAGMWGNIGNTVGTLGGIALYKGL